jgi:hypothetical protein
MCFYDIPRHYKKTLKYIRTINFKDKEGSGYKVKGVKKYKFKQSYPGYKVSHLTESKHHSIPRMSLPRNEKLYSMEKLE